MIVFTIIGVGWAASIITGGLLFTFAWVRERRNDRKSRDAGGPMRTGGESPPPPALSRGIARPRRKHQIAEGLGPAVRDVEPSPVVPYWRLDRSAQRAVDEILGKRGRRR